jgi:hypothetical protein
MLLYGVNALAPLGLCGFNLESHLLAESAGNEPAHAVGLPVSSFHNLLQAGTAGPFQQVQDLFGLAALAGAGGLFWNLGALAAFSVLFRRGGLFPRPSLRGRNVARTWRSACLFGRFWLLNSGSRGLWAVGSFSMVDVIIS